MTFTENGKLAACTKQAGRHDVGGVDLMLPDTEHVMSNDGKYRSQYKK